MELVYAFTAVLYFVCALRAGQLVMRAKGPLQLTGWDAWLPWVAAAAHAGLLLADVDVPEGLRFGFAQALSLLMLIGVVAFLIEERFVPISAMRPFVLGLAAVVAPLTLHFTGTVIRTPHWALTLHLWLAMAAYSMIGVAAVHAMYMVLVERGLQSSTARAAASGSSSGKVSLFVKMLTLHAPPLIPMERLLFKLIGAGFAVLTVALLLGIWLAVAESERGLRFDHKTVFSIAAWGVLGALLLGRHFSGWRGKTAIRWTLAGFAMLSLAYVGSRFVFEALLQRGGS
ncbi:MAG: cytochrome C assembly family protein [Burkholderiaceae bacterium]